jgi:hypothetical protein
MSDKRPATDQTDYRHRARVNVIAGLGIAVLVLIALVTVKLFFDHEKMQNCIDSGRRNCVDLDAPPREGVIIPVR